MRRFVTTIGWSLWVVCCWCGPALGAVPPSDPELARQWYLDAELTPPGQPPPVNVSAFGAWRRFTGSSTARVGVIAPGAISPTHPELLGRIQNREAGIGVSFDPTFMAGAIGAAGDNGQGIAGLHWACRVYGASADGIQYRAENVNAATTWMAQNGVSVVAMGWERRPQSVGIDPQEGTPDYVRAVSRVYASGGIAVVPLRSQAGVSGNAPDLTDADIPRLDLGTLNVQPTHNGGSLPAGHYPSAKADLSVATRNAEGANPFGIWSPPDGYAAYGDETRSSVAIVAGAAALVRDYAVSLGQSPTSDDVRGVLIASADRTSPLGWNSTYGYGHLNLSRAFEMLGAAYLRRTYVASGYHTLSGTRPYFHQVTLLAGNEWGVDPGTYLAYPCEVTIEVPLHRSDFSQLLGVWAQGRDCTGMIDGTMAAHHAVVDREDLTGRNTIRLRTKVYRLLTPGLGWVGYAPNPATLHWEYVEIGTPPPPPPLVATITGPSSAYAEQVYTWTASPSGGVGGYTYRWWAIEPHPFGVARIDPLGTGSSYTGSFPFGGSGSIGCTVVSGAEQVDAVLAVEHGWPSGGGGIDPPPDPEPIDGCPRPCFARGLHEGITDGVARGAVRLRYSIPRAGDVDLRVFDVTGRQVGVLHAGPMAAGRHVASWDTARLPAGVYLVRLRVGEDATAMRVSVVQ
jgi:hypothetical protein